MSRVIGKIENRSAKWQRAWKSSVTRINSVNDVLIGKLRSLATVAGAAGAAMGAVGFSIARTGADFEEAISAVGAVSLMTRDQIKPLEDMAKKLGATTKFTATEAANGMELMAKAGFTNAEILQGISGVLNAAAAEGAELAETASHVSNVLKGMGLATSEATRVADILALASARTNSSIGSLGESMANVSSTARQFKIPLEEVVAGVALLQDVGLDASVAGSAMNTMLTQLAAPTDAIVKKMKKFGVTWKDAEGNMLPLQEVLANMAVASKKSGGNMEQVAFFAELVGLRGQKAAANLKDLFESGKFGALAEELKGASGSAEKMAKLRMDNLKGDITLLNSAVDGLKVKLFETQGSPLRGVVQGMTDWVSKNEDLIVQKVDEKVKAIKEHLPEIEKWTKRIGVAAGAWLAFAIGAKAAAAAQFAFSVATGVASTSLTVLRGLLGVSALIAMRAYSAATAIAALATTRFTVAGIAAKTAELARLVVTRAANVATTIYAALQSRQAVVTGISTAATWLKNAALAAYTVATGGATVATMGLNAALLPIIVTFGAILAAVTAVIAAINQYKQLASEVDDVGKFFGDVFKTGSFSEAFNRMDERENEAARKRAQAQTRTVSPQERVARSVSETTTTNTSRVEVAAAPGTTAKVTKAPAKSSGVRLTPSGAFQ